MQLPEFDIAIVGGGVVGTTFACALKDSGFRIALIEAELTSQAVSRAQAYSISLLSSRIFEGMGIWQEIRSQVETYKRVQLTDANSPNAVKFAPNDIGTETLGYVAEHRVLISALHQLLKSCSNVELFCPAKVVKTEFQANGATLDVILNGEIQQIRSHLVIAADGSRSPLRQQAGIKTFGWQYGQACVVATLKLESPHDNTAYEWFWSTGPSGILPLTDDRYRIVWTTNRAEAEKLVALDDRQFIETFQQRYGSKFGTPQIEGNRYLFPIQLMHSRRYVLPQLALIGDAAHSCHPLGGQGINMGIRDAAALAQVLQTAQKRGEDIASLKVLRRYERWRQWENLIILSITDILNRTFSNQIFPIVQLRRFSLWFVQNIPPIRSLVFRIMSGLTGRAPQLAQR
ncbi:ubiquinone biosynthesis hydroxylase [Leptolyngbya boryana NIES-2135]|jgi:2-octaprenyl-6-methoxyphenol hydroxylase|uniref:Ubiquinone biosynthesis hydroxylase n=1 Tax=Leptolyngbya boryana NIES-2135 TaxID=1973484 RepID=A0A1Z4JQ51_LEPBY|nr:MULTISPECIES: FAD-dependent hydroxylase [Leptolyngbya]BAY58844.1 ubiquinone biosynthesis hydroxylase [Leptolyngbya boryana NIES-2135]MBD2370414.1 FAD-dependent hydroxylase [Leptolyngbya sp. FACHB-161]MBD2376907.1 FAD-dependent hydroxylase [Leptolyngbya sp. FACHB-238]MBD2401274.1 FAD-dependent hydroxylase [Leptolyngbya sp. FACHB-239]MBD2407825.1 FAD-dependent hydroxylase [Leptolyngbya sp. FACHB-402]